MLAASESELAVSVLETEDARSRNLAQRRDLAQRAATTLLRRVALTSDLTLRVAGQRSRTPPRRVAGRRRATAALQRKATLRRAVPIRAIQGRAGPIGADLRDLAGLRRAGLAADQTEVAAT